MDRPRRTLNVMSSKSPLRLDPDLDERLVRECLEGDPRAWEALVRRHERLVYAVARSFRLPESDQADVFQDVFAALVKGLPRLRDARALTRWLSRTTERIAYAAALRVRRAHALSPAVEREALEALPVDGRDVESDIEALEEQALVRLAIGSLAPRCRDLLHALYYADPPESYARIAKRLGMPVGSLGPTRARCFDRMRLAYLELVQVNPGRINDGARPTSAKDGDPPGRVRSARPAAPKEEPSP
jgi:RNA polymerase sigma factor (sigma-70 family)